MSSQEIKKNGEIKLAL